MRILTTLRLDADGDLWFGSQYLGPPADHYQDYIPKALVPSLRRIVAERRERANLESRREPTEGRPR